MNTSKKAERTKKVIGICLDCFIEKGLTVTTTTDLCNANNLQNGGIYYHLGTLADELSPVMRFLVSVCVSQEYGNKVSHTLYSLQVATLIIRKKLPRFSAAPQRR